MSGDAGGLYGASGAGDDAPSPCTAYGGPHDGGVIGTLPIENAGTLLFPLQSPPSSNVGLVHVYQWRGHPEQAGDCWLYMGVKSRAEVGG